VVAAVVCVGALVYLAVVRKPREVLEAPAAAAEADAGSDTGAEPEEHAEPAAVVLTKTDEPDER
jgi:hypothetical protein